MTTRGKTLWIVMLSIAFQMIFCNLPAETIFNETMGAASTITLIPAYTGWSNYGSVHYSGSADARNTYNSAGHYVGASGAGNIYFVGGINDNYQISGINTQGYTNIRLSLSLYKANSNATTGNAENGSNFQISYSVDSGQSWRRIPITIPTGSNTTGVYYWRELSENLPATDNLTLAFTNIGATEPVHFRMDDVVLTGTTNSLFNESLGAGTVNTAISNFTGWISSSAISFSGTGFVRNDLPSTDKYTGASGGGNILLETGQYLQISGINTTGYAIPALTVGVMKSHASENGSRLLMSYSLDGINWSTAQQCNTTGSGTNLWYKRAFPYIPITNNLRLRFNNTSTVGGSFRIDDIYLQSELTAPAIGFPSCSSISTTGAIFSANILSLGGANVTVRGFYYSTVTGFTDGSGTVVQESVAMNQAGEYNLPVSGLQSNTVYYYKAFATNSNGTTYSGQASVTTLPVTTSTSFTIDNTLPTAGTNFQTYAAAVSYLNANFAGSSTGFTFLMKDGQVFEDASGTTYNITASGTSVKQIIFQRDNSGTARPKLSRSVSGINVVVLSGADWVTFDGIDVQSAGLYGYYLTNPSSTNGAQHITIKNCTVTGAGYTGSSTTSGIYHAYATSPTTAAGKHSYNTFQSVTVTGFSYGIRLNGEATDIEISGCTITGLSAERYCVGIKVTSITNLEIFNNAINNLMVWSDFPIGIDIITCMGNVNIFNNKISSLTGYHDAIISSWKPLAGIRVERSTTYADIKIYNNMLWRLSAINDMSITDVLRRGIYIVPGSTSGTISIDFNTIMMGSSRSSTIGLELDSPQTNLRNNVIHMECSYAGYQNYGIQYEDLTASSGITDNNVIYLSDPSRGSHILAAGVPYTLESWQYATGRETASWAYNPKLISASDVHVITGADTPVESNGSYFNGAISWVTRDIDGNPRNISTPDIGADEGDFVFTAPLIPMNPASWTTSPLNAEEITCSATPNPAGNPILVAFNTTNTFGSPSGTYSAGATIVGGGTVAFVGSTQDLNLLTGFNPSTTYYLKVWSMLGTDRTVYYTYSSGIATSVITPARINLPASITVNPAGSGTFNYSSMSAALHAVKIGNIPTEGISVNVAAGYSETNASPLIIALNGTSAKPITIQKDPATFGANPLITRSDSGSLNTSVMGGYGDSVIRIDGCDYLTISNVDVSADNSGIEYGYLVHKPSATNGSQYLNIKNCTVSMNKGNSPYVTGIYIGNGTTNTASKIGLTVTNATGQNRYVTVSGSVVYNVHTGIHVQGSAATGFWDSNISIGQSGSLNQILNFGGVADSTCYGVIFDKVSNPTVRDTSIDNSLSPHNSQSHKTVYGIAFLKVDGAVLISDNYIKMANISPWAWTYWIADGNSSTSQTITNNGFAAGVISSSGSAYMIGGGSQSQTKIITGNASQGTISLTGASGHIEFYSHTMANTLGITWPVNETVSNNNFSNITATGNTSIYGISVSDLSIGTKTVSGNTLSNWSTQGATCGFYVTNDQSVSVFNNYIYDITTSKLWYGIKYKATTTAKAYNNVIGNITMTGEGTLAGIELGSNSTTGSCYNNKIYNLTGTHPATTVVGLLFNSSYPLASIYNNMIYGLSAVGPDTATDTPTVCGIKVGSINVNNIYYNTVFLNGSGTGAGYSSAALFLDISSVSASNGAYSKVRNNILVNKSNPGSLGKSVALWKSSTGSTGMDTSSNKNIYYAGVTDSQRLIAYLGTVSCPTLEIYKSTAATIDQASFWEDVPFVSSSGNIDVHINPTIPTYVQNQASAITGYTTDIDGHTRNATTPDIGADEGNFTIAPTCVAPTAQPTNLILVPSDTSINIHFTASSSQTYLVLRHTATTPSITPVNGTNYYSGQILGNSTVLSVSGATTCLTSGLNQGTLYYISVYAYNSFGFTAPKYLTTAPLRQAVTTLSTSHGNPAVFTATGLSTSSIALNLTANAAGDNILLAYSFDPAFGAPLGTYSLGDNITGGGTVLYKGMASGVGNHTGLLPWTKVYYKAWSYYTIDRTTYYSYTTGITAETRSLIDPLAETMTVNPGISGARNFCSLSDAVAALNYVGVSAGGVTINVIADHRETITAPIVMSASGYSGSPIIIQKDPSTTGENPLIIRSDAGQLVTTVLGGDGDSIIRIEGSDYLSFDGIDLNATNSGIEYGYLTGKPNATNGCQVLSIKNCTVTMTKATNLVAGIYVSNGPTATDNSSGVSVTAAGGRNSMITVSGATIRNTNNSILLIGSTASAYPDTDYFVGLEGARNFIEDYDGTTAVGITVKNINNPSICFNTINNAAAGGIFNSTGNFSGINLAAVTGVITASYNFITMSVNSYIDAPVYWISNTGTGTSESYIGNTFAAGNNNRSYGVSRLIYLNNGTLARMASDNSIVGTISNTSWVSMVAYYSIGSAPTGTEIVTNNNFSNIQAGGIYGLYSSSDRSSYIISGNTISNLSYFISAGIYCSAPTSSNCIISNNTMSNWAHDNYSTVYGIRVVNVTSDISGNLLSNLNASATSTSLHGISQSGGSTICSNNIVTNLSAPVQVLGISQSGESAICRNNLVSNLHGTINTSVVKGLYIFDVQGSEVSNNVIHSLTTVGATISAPCITGISATCSYYSFALHKIYYNSVLLSAGGTGSNFSTAGLYMVNGNFDLRNNIVVNKSTAGSLGRRVAVWKDSGSGSITSTSNNNIYNVGTTSTSYPYTNMIAYINSSIRLNLSDYQGSISPAELNSKTEDVPFVSSTGTVDLHINPSIATYVESRAMPIPGYDTDHEGNSRNSATPDIGAYEGNFIPRDLPPLPAINPSPADLASEQLTTVQLSWNRDSSGLAPTTYRVYFGTANPPPLATTQAGTTYNPGVLAYGQTYYWKIDPANSYGNASSRITIPVWSFTTYSPLPEPAVLGSPANGASNIAINTGFTWSTGTGIAPSGYKLYLGTDNPPTNVLNGTDLGDVTSYVPGLSRQPQTKSGSRSTVNVSSDISSRSATETLLSGNSLNYNTVYYWKVVPYTATGNAVNCPVWSFTTEFAPVPNIVVNPVPVNLSTSIPISQILGWSANPAGTVPDSYNVYFGTSNPPALIGNQETSTFSPGTLEYNTTYYWQIDPHSLSGYCSQSNTIPVWRFTTELAPVPSIAVNPVPANLSTSIPISQLLGWSANPAGTVPDSYNVYFGTSNPPTMIGNQETTTFSPGTLEYNTTYYWQIDPHSPGGYCSQSNTIPVWSFTTEYSLFPSQAVLVSPGNGSSISDTGLSLNWSAGTGTLPIGYRIYLGTNNPPSNLLNGLDLGVVTSCNPAGLLSSTTYYWKVVPYNSLGDASPTPIWNFHIAPQDVSIGTGTGTNRSPFGTAYGYERDATLYTAAEIGNLPQPIRSLAWYATANVSTVTPVKIYLKATTSSILPNVNWAGTISGATLVYNGSISSISANAWMNIVLTSAFSLPSGNNLMVMIETNWGGSGNGGSGGAFRNTNYSPVNTLHKYWFSNTAPPTSVGNYDILRANIRLSSSNSVTALPNPAVCTAPLSGANAVPLNSTLSWTSGGGTVTGYKLYLGTDGSGLTTPSNLVYGLDLGTITSYTLPVSFDYSTTYYWRVIPYNNAGAALGGNIWIFTTVSEPILSLNSPTNPVLTAFGELLELSWDAVPQATSYAIYAANEPDPSAWGEAIAIVFINHYIVLPTDRRFYRIVARN